MYNVQAAKTAKEERNMKERETVRSMMGLLQCTVVDIKPQQLVCEYTCM